MQLIAVHSDQSGLRLVGDWSNEWFSSLMDGVWSISDSYGKQSYHMWVVQNVFFWYPM